MNKLSYLTIVMLLLGWLSNWLLADLSVVAFASVACRLACHALSPCVAAALDCTLTCWFFTAVAAVFAVSFVVPPPALEWAAVLAPGWNLLGLPTLCVGFGGDGRGIGWLNDGAAKDDDDALSPPHPSPPLAGACKPDEGDGRAGAADAVGP